MKHFVVALATILLHKAVTETFSISYNLLSAPFDAFRLLVDLTIFAAIYVALNVTLGARFAPDRKAGSSATSRPEDRPPE